MIVLELNRALRANNVRRSEKCASPRAKIFGPERTNSFYAIPQSAARALKSRHSANPGGGASVAWTISPSGRKIAYREDEMTANAESKSDVGKNLG